MDAHQLETATVSTDDEGIGIWLHVGSAWGSQRLRAYVKQLAEPDFRLDACRRTSSRADTRSRQTAPLHCRFLPRARDSFAGLRLLKRLTGAGFEVLRYDAPYAAARRAGVRTSQSLS